MPLQDCDRWNPEWLAAGRRALLKGPCNDIVPELLDDASMDPRRCVEDMYIFKKCVDSMKDILVHRHFCFPVDSARLRGADCVHVTFATNSAEILSILSIRLHLLELIRIRFA